MSVVPIFSQELDALELSWFAPICSDDFRFLGVPENDLKSNWNNTSQILLKADELGFRNILCPSSYQVGQDSMSFAASMAPLTKNINILVAVRCGELHPAMLARAIATIDHCMQGRLTINIISSNMPGADQSSAYRYALSWEVVEILKQAWTQEQINFEGTHYQLKNLSTDPVKPYQQNGGPLLYFGGYSPPAINLCAAHCDVYLMWPETKALLKERMQTVHKQAEEYNRVLDYGLRVHMIVRDSEKEAKEYAEFLISKLDDQIGETIKSRALDSTSLGVALQSKNRSSANEDGYVEDGLWTGIGRARSGCGAALVGSVDQILTKIEDYQKMGIRSFIFSGYPHLDECEIVGTKILPQLKSCSLPEVYGRVPTTTPKTPLGLGERT